jgi:SAM-dependent methyltransferase
VKFSQALRSPFRRKSDRLASIGKRVEELEIQLSQFISLVSIKDQLLPIPPKHLQIRVAGAYYPTFFQHGKDMFYDLEDFLKSAGLSMFDFDRILDFGCGCGRFMIPMSFLLPPKKISGTDIDKEAIQWFKENYPCFHDLDVNGFNPPTKYAGATFDFVFSISIFTHLPEEMQHAWLKELSRIIKPGGYGIFTTHGENHFHHLNQAARTELLTRGFYYLAGDTTDGLPEFYQTSFHTGEYVQREWSRYFDVLAIRKNGVGKAQDAVLVKKRLVADCG